MRPRLQGSTYGHTKSPNCKDPFTNYVKSPAKGGSGRGALTAITNSKLKSSRLLRLRNMRNDFVVNDQMQISSDHGCQHTSNKDSRSEERNMYSSRALQSKNSAQRRCLQKLSHHTCCSARYAVHHEMMNQAIAIHRGTTQLHQTRAFTHGVVFSWAHKMNRISCMRRIASSSTV